MIHVGEPLLAAIDEVADRLLGGEGRLVEGRLAEAVAELSALYNRRRTGPGAARGRALAARLRFFLPRDLPKIGFPLDELASVGLLPAARRWRVLDVGAGLGASCLGVAAFAGQRNLADSLAIEALDRDARCLQLLAALAERVANGPLPALDVRTRVADVEDVDATFASLPDGPFDLIVLGFVLNELGAGSERVAIDRRTELLGRLTQRLAPHGSLIVLEPALRGTSRSLQAVRDRIVADAGPAHVFAPCLRAGDCPMLHDDRDWCHEAADMTLPSSLVPVARAAGLRFERLTWSYLTLRRDGRNLRELAEQGGGETYRIVSALLPSKGKLEVIGCGGPGLPRMMRLDREASDANAAFEQLGRGCLASVDPGEPEPGKPRLRIRSRTRVRRLR